jgi:hypothetical protein
MHIHQASAALVWLLHLPGGVVLQQGLLLLAVKLVSAAHSMLSCCYYPCMAVRPTPAQTHQPVLGFE